MMGRDLWHKDLQHFQLDPLPHQHMSIFQPNLQQDHHQDQGIQEIQQPIPFFQPDPLQLMFIYQQDLQSPPPNQWYAS